MTDGTYEWLKTYNPDFNLEILTHPDNKHKGKEKTRNLTLNKLTAPYVNLTLNKLTAPYVLFFDSDLFPTGNLVAEHLTILREGVVSLGSIVYLNAEENLWAYYSNYGELRYAYKIFYGSRRTIRKFYRIRRR